MRLAVLQSLSMQLRRALAWVAWDNWCLCKVEVQNRDAIIPREKVLGFLVVQAALALDDLNLKISSHRCDASTNWQGNPC